MGRRDWRARVIEEWTRPVCAGQAPAEHSAQATEHEGPDRSGQSIGDGPVAEGELPECTRSHGAERLVHRYVQRVEIQAGVDQAQEVELVRTGRVANRRAATGRIPAQEVAVSQANAGEVLRPFRDGQVAWRDLEDRRAPVVVEHGIRVADVVREGLAIVAIADRSNDAGRRNRAQHAAYRRT